MFAAAAALTRTVAFMTVVESTRVTLTSARVSRRVQTLRRARRTLGTRARSARAYVRIYAYASEPRARCGGLGRVSARSAHCHADHAERRAQSSHRRGDACTVPAKLWSSYHTSHRDSSVGNWRVSCGGGRVSTFPRMLPRSRLHQYGKPASPAGSRQQHSSGLAARSKQTAVKHRAEPRARRVRPEAAPRPQSLVPSPFSFPPIRPPSTPPPSR